MKRFVIFSFAAAYLTYVALLVLLLWPAINITAAWLAAYLVEHVIK